MIKKLKPYLIPFRKLVYTLTGKKPWSYGYVDFRWSYIYESISNVDVLKHFLNGEVPQSFGLGMDERVVEYPWILSRLSNESGISMLDAGSTFNFPELVNHKKVSPKNLTIFTYYPEDNQFLNKRISYHFGDLRQMPFRDSCYDEIVCQSTIEHVDMDNSIYGYSIAAHQNNQTKSYAYISVVNELVRVLKSGGKLLLTLPYGKFENHGFFQQFDEEMLAKIIDVLNVSGKCSTDFLHYKSTGWIFDHQQNCNSSESYNPHTGKGQSNDGAAHCRCVCCIEFVKNQ
ncbi:MAG: methyltransferase domain-containing protein [Bacteroidota bacterium]